MTQLYRNKWTSCEGEIYKDQDQTVFADGFLLWCRKTEGLSDEQWQSGFSTLEDEIRNLTRAGKPDDAWPPSYASFVEKCKGKHGSNWKAYRVFDSSKQIEDKAAKEERYKKGVEHCNSILKLFR